MNEIQEAMKYIEMGIDIKRNIKNVIFTNNVVYDYGFLVAKFNLMIRIPTTSKKDVLKTGIKLLDKLPKTLDIFDFIIKVINDLSSPLPSIKFQREVESEGLDYFIEPCLDKVETPNGILSLEKMGSSSIFVEYGKNKRYSLPFIFMDKPCVCKKFYRDENGYLSFILQTRESISEFKLMDEPELN
jgi:hypothetical protein